MFDTGTNIHAFTSTLFRSLVTTYVFFPHAAITCNVTANHRQRYQILITWLTSGGRNLPPKDETYFDTWHFGRCRRRTKVQYPALIISVCGVDTIRCQTFPQLWNLTSDRRQTFSCCSLIWSYSGSGDAAVHPDFTVVTCLDSVHMWSCPQIAGSMPTCHRGN